MTIIDPSSNLGKLRLRVGDYSDLPYLPDSVYLQTLEDNSGDLVRAAKTCAMYILGQLSFKVRRKMGLQLEVHAGEAFKNYKEFLLLTVTNPAFMDVSPIPYSASSTTDNPLVQFSKDWNNNYYSGTQSQDLAFTADAGPNEGGRYGPLGNSTTSGWYLV